MSKNFFEIKTASPSNPSLWIDTGNELFGWFWLVWFVVVVFFCYLKSVKKYKVAKLKQILCLFVFKADCLFHIVSVVTDFGLWGERTKNSILLPWVQGELLWAIEQKCYEVNERLIELMITTAFLCSETSGFVWHHALYLYARPEVHVTGHVKSDHPLSLGTAGLHHVALDCDLRIFVLPSALQFHEGGRTLAYKIMLCCWRSWVKVSAPPPLLIEGVLAWSEGYERFWRQRDFSRDRGSAQEGKAELKRCGALVISF